MTYDEKNMKWTHKKTDITINYDGLFVFEFYNKKYKVKSLEEAQKTIDTETEEYYTFDTASYEKMKSKLDEREALFLDQLIDEVCEHEYNNYCDLGITCLDFKIRI